MTAYGPPRQDDQEQPEWMKSKLENKKKLAEVEAKRRENYKRFLEKKRRANNHVAK